MSLLTPKESSLERESDANGICCDHAWDGDDLRRKLMMLRDAIIVVGSMVYLRAMLLLRPWNC